MAIQGLIRVTDVADLLGIGAETLRRALAKASLPTLQLEVIGMPGRDRNGRTHSTAPHYVSVEVSLSIICTLLPGLVNAGARRRAKARLERRQALREGQGSRVVHDEVGGRGAGRLP